MSPGFLFRSGNNELSRTCANQAVEIAIHLGDPILYGNALNNLSLSTSDLSKQINFLKMALARYEISRAYSRQAVMTYNLGLSYLELGLFNRAAELIENASNFATKTNNYASLLLYSLFLALTYGRQNQFEKANHKLDDFISLADQIGQKEANLPLYNLFKGLNLLLKAEYEKAETHIYEAYEGLRSTGMPQQANAQGVLGEIFLAKGKVKKALEATTTATALIEHFHGARVIFYPQIIWLYHYKALKANKASLRDPNEIWRAIDQSLSLMLRSISTLSDDGLRRNYFNKFVSSLEIFRIWRAEAKRGEPITKLTDQFQIYGGFRGNFQKRLVEIGTYEYRYLIYNFDWFNFIMDELLELTGRNKRAFH